MHGQRCIVSICAHSETEGFSIFFSLILILYRNGNIYPKLKKRHTLEFRLIIVPPITPSPTLSRSTLLSIAISEIAIFLYIIYINIAIFSEIQFCLLLKSAYKQSSFLLSSFFSMPQNSPRCSIRLLSVSLSFQIYTYIYI